MRRHVDHERVAVGIATKQIALAIVMPLGMFDGASYHLQHSGDRIEICHVKGMRRIFRTRRCLLPFEQILHPSAAQLQPGEIGDICQAGNLSEPTLTAAEPETPGRFPDHRPDVVDVGSVGHAHERTNHSENLETVGRKRRHVSYGPGVEQ
jgi:hypothetical protein